MNSLDLLNDYEQFTAFFQSLNTVDSSDPGDLEEILSSLPEENSHELY